MTTINVDRHNDTVRVRMTDDATGREVAIDLKDDAAHALIRHLQTHAYKPHFVLEPAGATLTTDVWRAMVAMFNRLSDRRITREDVDAIPERLRHLFKEVT